MTGPKTAMILAAGLGLRMRPLTDDKPKAMVVVSGQPLIGHLLDHLNAIGIEKIVVNLHYQPDPLIKYLQAHPLAKKIVFSHEVDQILDTGGGVKAALSHLGAAPFFVVNCDAFFPDKGDNPFTRLAESWQDDMAAKLLLKETGAAVGYAGAGDFYLDDNARLRRWGADATAPYTFTGAQILTPGLFDGVVDEIFSLNKIYDRALADSALYGVTLSGPWLHMGTPEMVTKAEEF